MGMLGLDNLLYFAREYPGPSSHVLSHSHHPKYGYTFAIVGINLTSMAYHLLKDGSAKTYVYNISRSLPTMKVFHQLYCYLFYEFDRFWIESKPQNMMEFSCIQERFEKSIRSGLADKTSVFKMNIEVDNVWHIFSALSSKLLKHRCNMIYVPATSFCDFETFYVIIK